LTAGKDEDRHDRSPPRPMGIISAQLQSLWLQRENTMRGIPNA
jgi:hypothetical protein